MPPTRPAPAKRPAADQHDPSISPPPTKRADKAPRKTKTTTTTTTAAAVASFFTPASQKPKDRTVWEERAPAPGAPTSLLVAKYQTDAAATATATPSGPGAAPVALFDLDSTLITTASGKKHADGPGDWKWWHPSVPGRLRALHAEGVRIAIVSNQGGLTLHPGAKKTPAQRATAAERVASYKRKCGAVLAALDVPVVGLYAACGHDRFRKPQAGIWGEVVRDVAGGTGAGTGAEGGGDGEGGGEGGGEKSSVGDKSTDGARAGDAKTGDDTPLDIPPDTTPHPASFFVGDAAGRKGDFACSDRDFAANADLAFHTPEEYFLGAAPQPFTRAFDPGAVGDDEDDGGEDKTTADEEVEALLQEISSSPPPHLLVFVGPPAAGKSSFFHTHLAPRGVRRVNQDTLKTRDKCVQAAAALLKEGHSVAIDNTNPDVATRRVWLDLAAEHKVPARCLWFQTDPLVCAHNDAVRAAHPAHPVLNPDGRGALPKIAFHGFHARFRPPMAAEGFAAIVTIPFRFRGGKAVHAIWSRYWV